MLCFSVQLRDVDFLYWKVYFPVIISIMFKYLHNEKRFYKHGTQVKSFASQAKIIFNVIKGRWLLMQRYFCAVYDHAGKVDFSKGGWNPKRKLGVTMNFTPIIVKKP